MGPVENANKFAFELAPGIEWTGPDKFAMARQLVFVPAEATVILENDVAILDVEIGAQRLGG